MSKPTPVTVQSTPAQILEAFKRSGYVSLLTRELRGLMRKDPVGWLRGHPYLYAWYPAFFRDSSGIVKSTPETKRAAKQKLKRGVT